MIKPTDKNERIGLHIGLPKTGTTSLQDLCFARHPDVTYFGQTNVWESSNAKTVLKALLLDRNDLDLWNNAIEIVNNVLSTGKALVISDEALSLGEFMLRAGSWPIKTEHELIARRAYELLGNAQVLIVLRNQPDWIESWQKQGLKNSKYIEKNYDLWLKNDLGESAQRLFSLLDYEKLYKAYINVFGVDNVHVKLYENYTHSVEEIGVDFLCLLGIAPERTIGLMSDKKKNVSGNKFNALPTAVYKIIRTKNIKKIINLIPKAVKTPLRKLLQVEKKYISLNEDCKTEILRNYEDSNRRLFDMLGINANGLGYF
jgi:hypothetical protein